VSGQTKDNTNYHGQHVRLESGQTKDNKNYHGQHARLESGQTKDNKIGSHVFTTYPLCTQH
jgi:uncharacterized protein YwbE